MNDTDRNGRFKYSQSEKETLKVMKMQENDLNSLEEETIFQTKDLDDIRKRVEALARELNVPIKPKAAIEDIDDSPYQIKEDEIPEWDELVARANSEINYDVIIEDLLTKEEFNYCIEDVERINNEFSRKTSIWNKRDLAFLALATGLQTARWIILQLIMDDLGAENRGEREGSKEADKRKKKENDEYNKRHQDRDNKGSENGYPTWKDIVFGQYVRTDGGKSKGVCPYDSQKGGPVGFNDGGKGQHRVNTLGHDPLLGWIFGTANLMTCSISCSKRFGFANHMSISWWSFWYEDILCRNVQGVM